MMIIRFAVGHH